MKIELKTTGNNASGKTRILKKVKAYLEKAGLKVKEGNHTLMIEGEFSK